MLLLDRRPVRRCRFYTLHESQIRGVKADRGTTTHSFLMPSAFRIFCQTLHFFIHQFITRNSVVDRGNRNFALLCELDTAGYAISQFFWKWKSRSLEMYRSERTLHLV